MVAKKQISPERLAEAKRLYEQTLAPVDDIAAMVGLSRTNFYKRVREGKWRGRRAQVGTFEFARALSGDAVTAMIGAAAESRAEILPPCPPVSPQQRAAIAHRMLSVVEKQMDAIARIVDNIKPTNPAEAEQGARAVAFVTRSLREIAALNKNEDEAPSDEAADDPLPRDIDEFRYELARRIHEIVEGHTGGTAGEDRPVLSGPVAGGT
ncbi:MAG: hypothetical protein WDN48_05060 [Pseudolabrys sp.]